MSVIDVRRLLTDARQEAYTGPNRCWPCTVLNAGLVVIVAAIVGVFLSPLVGGATLLVGVATIWLRGYLVPYTPWLTSRVLGVLSGDLVLHRTPPDPMKRDAADGTEVQSATGVVDRLLAAAVLVENGDELSLAPAFRDAWRAEIEEKRPYDLDALADAMEKTIHWVAESSVVADGGRDWIRLTDEEGDIQNETWLALPAAVADLTAVRTLNAQTDLTVNQRTLAAPPLRQFLERCPVCDDRLEVTSPRACCGSPRHVAQGIEAVLSCPTCDEIVTVLRIDEPD